MLIYKIRGNLAKLNEHDQANRANRFAGAKLKEKMNELVIKSLESQLDKKITKPCMIGFCWYYSSKHDFDNIRFAAKYVLDGMQKAGVLPNDNQNWVKGFMGDVFVKVEKGQEGVDVNVEEIG